METVTISKEEYEDLIGCRDFLDALMAAGVDNWDGYELAQEIIGD